jgi:hypothetical protein
LAWAPPYRAAAIATDGIVPGVDRCWLAIEYDATAPQEENCPSDFFETSMDNKQLLDASAPAE